MRNAQVTFAESPEMKINSFYELKHKNLIHTGSHIAFKDTVGHRHLCMECYLKLR